MKTDNQCELNNVSKALKRVGMMALATSKCKQGNEQEKSK